MVIGTQVFVCFIDSMQVFVIVVKFVFVSLIVCK